jgi:hypothetical protein
VETEAGDVDDRELDSANLWSALRTPVCELLVGPTRGATEQVVMVAVLSSVREAISYPRSRPARRNPSDAKPRTDAGKTSGGLWGVGWRNGSSYVPLGRRKACSRAAPILAAKSSNEKLQTRL